MALKTLWTKYMTPPLMTQTSGTRAAIRLMAEPRLRLRARDLDIVEAVHRLRVLSTEQIAQLFFPTVGDGVSTACRTRLRRLAVAGLLERAEQEQRKTDGRRPYLYMLTEAGGRLLVDELGLEPDELDWQPSYNDVRWPFLRHQLAINDAYVAFTQGAAAIGWSVDSWTDDRILRKTHTDRVKVPGTGQSVAVVPDAYFKLVGPGQSPIMHFFMEIDRATMTVAAESQRVRSWQDKIKAYQESFAKGHVAARYGTDKVRVLTVTTGPQRLAHLKAATEQLGCRSRYWFATGSDLITSTVLQSPIWQRAGRSGAVELISIP